jgi:hypothetical protein
MAEFERIVTVRPAFEKRDPDPAKDYGIGACKITFILKGPKGATQFMIGTDWYLPHLQHEHRASNYEMAVKYNQIQPQGWDVGYHSPKPMYDSHTAMDHACDLVEGGKCFYDGSSLRADEWIPKFIRGGTDWLWPALEEEYRYRFEREEENAA